MKPLRTKVRLSGEDRFVNIVVAVVLALVFFCSLYPFYLAVVLSFNEGFDAQSGGIYFWPRKFSLENYTRLFSDREWFTAIFVSIARTVLGTSITVFFTVLVAYGLSRRDLVGRKVYFGIIIFAMYFSGGIIPYYAILKQLNLLNNFLVYIIPGALNIFYMLVSISFIQALPSELMDAARVDGAGEIKTLLSIVLPLSLPLLATIAIFVSVGQWNSWYDSAFFVTSKSKSYLHPLAYKLIEVVRRANINTASAAGAGLDVASRVKATSLSLQLAGMVVAVFPILAVYPFFQKYIVSGITLGGVKG
ncbi:sugar ABC transporter permease [Spirochaetia bacterium]|nr:sugar ABC transporter permease [Spirochaetia bacterium]